MRSVSATTEQDYLSLCTVCGEDHWRFVRAGRDLYQPHDEADFKLYQCLSCGQVMQNPLPTGQQLSKAYSAEYAPYRPAWNETGWALWKVLRELTTWRRMRRLRRYGKGSKLLEVGCGAGDFLRAAHGAGWEVKAVEYSSALAEALRTELGFDVRTGDLTVGLWSRDSFDVVVMWSVLEHLSNPLDALIAACSYLRPGGTLLIQIPTLYGVRQGKHFAQYWALLDLPRHLSFFGRHELSRLCDQAGLDMIEFKTPLVESAWCYYASIGSFAVREKRPWRKLFGSIGLAIVTVLSLPIIATRAWLGRGTEAFAVAVKR